VPEQDVAGLHLGAAHALDLDDVEAELRPDRRAHLARPQRERDVRELAHHVAAAEEAEVAAALARAVLAVRARAARSPRGRGCARTRSRRAGACAASASADGSVRTSTCWNVTVGGPLVELLAALLERPRAAPAP
jgi:plasmid stabilization system protein ParE